MNENFYAMVAAVLGSGTLATIVTSIVSRKKTRAQGRSLEVHGELQIVDSAVKVVESLRIDFDRLREEVDAVKRENLMLRAEVTELTREVHLLQMENQQLRRRCEVLEAENHALKNPGDPVDGDDRGQ